MAIYYRTLRENVVEAIRDKIINQELKPGERIVEMDLAEEFKTSRGPVREALRQLEHELTYTRQEVEFLKKTQMADMETRRQWESKHRSK